MPDTEMRRADVLLCEQGLAPSREKARALIAAGLAYADGAAIEKPARKLSPETKLELHGESCPYVSRGGLKLEKALYVFSVSPEGLVCLDVGASTGGFTDVLLKNGAKKVYAVDVGTAQLAPALLKDSRVVSMEKINARAMTLDLFPERPQLAVMDVSFISIRKILPALREVLKPDGRLISLIKPQFEAGRERLGKRGIILNPVVHEAVLREIVAFAPEAGFRVRALDFSPISGGDGNIEFLADFQMDLGNLSSPDSAVIRELVRRAHSALKQKK